MVTSIRQSVLPRSLPLETSVPLHARKVSEWRVHHCDNAEAVVPGVEDNICLVVLVSYFGVSYCVFTHLHPQMLSRLPSHAPRT